VECVNCHGTLSPPDPNHYSETPTRRAPETGCDNCHYMTLKAEHDKTTVGIDCVECHTSTLFVNMPKPWDDTCLGCHVTKHGQRNAKHTPRTQRAVARVSRHRRRLSDPRSAAAERLPDLSHGPRRLRRGQD